MYKSTVVKLVFLNSVLAFSACARTCDSDDVRKDDPQLAERKDQPRRSCYGSYRRTGTNFIYFGGGHTRGTGGRMGHAGSGSVGRGGFGASGHGGGS